MLTLLRNRSPQWWLSALLVAAGVFTFAYALYFEIVPQVDARVYDHIGTNIAAGNGYRADASVPETQDIAIASVGPLYESFLGFFFRYFGHVLVIVWFAQTLLYVATGFLLYLIARRTFPERGEAIGLVAAALYLFFIDVIQMPAMLMTETVFLFLLTLSTYLLLRFQASGKSGDAALFALVSSLAVFTRPIALLILLVGIGLAFLMRRARTGLLMLLIALIVIAPWPIRNTLTYGTFIFTTSAGGYDLWLGNNPGADGGARMTAEIEAYAKNHTVIETGKHGMEEARTFILTEPVAFVKLLFRKAVAYFSVARPYGFWFYLTGMAQKLVLGWSALWSYILFIAGFSGVWLLLRSNDMRIRLLLIFAALMPLSVIPIIVETRYRLPLYPFLAIFGGYFVIRAYSAWSSKDKKSVKAYFILALVVAAVVAVISGIDILYNLPVILERLGGL